MLSRGEIIDTLVRFARSTDYQKMWIFGSVARDEHDEFSDIDVIVEDGGKVLLDDMFRLMGLMTELSGQEMNDILTTRQLEKMKNNNSQLTQSKYCNINRDKILIYSVEDVNDET